MSDGVFAPGSTHDVYEVERLIAEGAEAHVYRGKTLNNRTVALKVYKRTFHEKGHYRSGV